MPVSGVEREVCAWIEGRRDRLLDDLRLHVGLPTGFNNTKALDETRDRFTSRLADLGAQTELLPGDPKPAWLLGKQIDDRIPPTAVCRRNLGTGKRILIAGHLDTVHDPAGNFRELTIAPDNKTATGPGCVDMKGGLVIAACALEALHACNVEADWTFLLNSDEETGSYHSNRHIEEESKKHDWGLALEPALPGGELAVERGGSGQFMIECRGKAAHVGRDFGSGVSAVYALGGCLVGCSGFSDVARGLAVNVGPIEGGAATNAVPDRAVGWGNVRYRDAAGADELWEKLGSLATDRDAMPRVVVERSFNRPAKPMTSGTERLALAARRVAEDLGQVLPFASTGGVCDGNIMQHAGLPTIDTLGVRGGNLHRPDEWIELASLVERCQLLAVLIARLSRGA